MRKFLLLILFCGSAHAMCTVTDDAKITLHLNSPAKQIISLAPDTTETLFAIGAGKQIVGVIKGSDYPKAATKIPIVGSYTGLDLEKIISLQPDLIVVWGDTFARQLNTLKKSGIPIYTSNPQTLADIPKTMRNLACLTGQQAKGEAQAQQFSAGITKLQKQYQAQKPVRVFYQIGNYSLITINKSSWINQVISLCGGRNIFANAQFSAPEVTWEAVVVANPQVIISDAINSDWKKSWYKHTEISAVKHNFLFSINPDLLERAGPRLVMGATQMCKDIKLSSLVVDSTDH